MICYIAEAGVGDTDVDKVHDKQLQRQVVCDYEGSTDSAVVETDKEVKGIENATTKPLIVDVSEVDTTAKVPYLKI